MMIELMMAAVLPLGGATNASGVVSFKDAAKIKSWDAWHDHETPKAWSEKRCVTKERLEKVVSGLPEIGRFDVLRTNAVRSLRWSVGCECLDRDYADWDQYKRFLFELGVGRARFFSGWAKTEQEKGVYDFAWLDKPIRQCAVGGVKPWICLSYGNPVWGSDFRLGMRVEQVTGNAEAFAAWIRYVKAVVARYRDVVDTWEVWNEPFAQADAYAKLLVETVRAIKEVQPEATCIATALGWAKPPEKSEYFKVLMRVKEAGALEQIRRWAYHPYCKNPDTSYDGFELKLRKLVKSFDAKADILQGETGCPSQLEYAHALAEHEWTEYAQAKWNLRRAVGDAARDIPSNLFTLIDLQYTFMLQSFGLVRANALKEPVYRRPSYFAMRNLYALIDDRTVAKGFHTVETNGRKLAVATFTREGRRMTAAWFCDRDPSDELGYERVSCGLLGVPKGLVWADPLTDRLCRQDGEDVPVWDSPVFLLEYGISRR